MLKREKLNTALKSPGKRNSQASEFDNASALRLKQAAASGNGSFLEILKSLLPAYQVIKTGSLKKILSRVVRIMIYILGKSKFLIRFA